MCRSCSLRPRVATTVHDPGTSEADLEEANHELFDSFYGFRWPCIGPDGATGFRRDASMGAERTGVGRSAGPRAHPGSDRGEPNSGCARHRRRLRSCERAPQPRPEPFSDVRVTRAGAHFRGRHRRVHARRRADRPRRPVAVFGAAYSHLHDSGTCERSRAGPLGARPESRRIRVFSTYWMTSHTIEFSNVQSQDMPTR